LSAFPAIVGDGTGTPNPKHGVFHSIETVGRPVFAKPRRLDPEKHLITEAEFSDHSQTTSAIPRHDQFLPKVFAKDCCSCLCYLRRRLRSRPFLQMGATVRAAGGNHQ
jgi:hypothetical protein